MGKKTRLSELNEQINTPTKTQAQEPSHLELSHTIEANAPRGQRADFLKLTITMPSDMLLAMKTVGMKRKSTGHKDCDTSSLIREAVSAWLASQ